MVKLVCLAFCKYVKRHVYPVNQGTYDKLNQIQKIHHKHKIMITLLGKASKTYNDKKFYNEAKTIIVVDIWLMENIFFEFRPIS